MDNERRSNLPDDPGADNGRKCDPRSLPDLSGDNARTSLPSDPGRRDELIIYTQISALWLANILAVGSLGGSFYCALHSINWPLYPWVPTVILSVYGGMTLRGLIPRNLFQKKDKDNDKPS